MTWPILLQQGSSISMESVNKKKITVTKRGSRREEGMSGFMGCVNVVHNCGRHGAYSQRWLTFKELK